MPKREKALKAPKSEKNTHARIHENVINYLKEFNSAYVVCHTDPDVYVSGDIRHICKPSRFLFGRIEILRGALLEGFQGSPDQKEEFSKFIYTLKGRAGLFFTNKPKQETLDWFNNYSGDLYAKTGVRAPKGVVLNKGPHPEIRIGKESNLRKLYSVPSVVQNGVVVLLKDFEVCREGLPLSRAQYKMLKLLDIPLLKKTFSVLGSWTNENGFEDYAKV